MLGLEEQARVWLVLGRTDMRKSINGLSDLVQPTEARCHERAVFRILWAEAEYAEDPLLGRNGYCVWYKRLEIDRFRWPRNENEAQAITGEQLGMVIVGAGYRASPSAEIIFGIKAT